MRRIACICLAAAAILLAGCSSTSPSSTTATNTPSAPAATAPATTNPTASPLAVSSESPVTTPTTTPAPFALSSPSFRDGGSIPTKFSCDGAGVSPEVAWAGAPTGTRALAFTVLDPDAGDFVHWLVFDVPGASSGSLPENVGTGSGAPPQGRNSRGDRGYTGPCPPSGRHHYVFTLYALDAPTGLTGTPSRSQIEAAIKGHVLAKTVLTGTYKRS
jgi:hypothetical protein